MSGKNFMSYGDADTILTEFSNDIKSRVSTKANQGLTAQQIANAKANIDIDKVPNVATNDQTPTFLEESTRTNIASGDKLSLIFGKIKKFFSDLKTVAFTGSYNDLTDKPPEFVDDPSGYLTHDSIIVEHEGQRYEQQYYHAEVGNTARTLCAGNDSRLSNARPASDVYAWAKAATKPTYTASEVGALPLTGGTMTGVTEYSVNKVVENYRPGNPTYYTTTAYLTDGNEAMVWSTKFAATSFMFVNGEDMITNISSGRWRQLTPGLQIKNNKVAINKLIDTDVTPAHTLDVNGDICCNNFDAATLKTGNRSYGEHNCNNMVTNGFYYYTSNGPSTSIGASTNDGGVFVQAYSDVWVGQVAIDYRNGKCFFRGRNNGTWTAWQAFKSQADVDSAYSSGLQQGLSVLKDIQFIISNETSSASARDVIQLPVSSYSSISFSHGTSDRNTDGWLYGYWITDGGSQTTAFSNLHSTTSDATKTCSIPSGAKWLRIEGYVSTTTNRGRMWLTDFTYTT